MRDFLDPACPCVNQHDIYENSGYGPCHCACHLKRRSRKVKISATLSAVDIKALRELATLPWWVLSEFYEKFSESNVGPLPIGAARRLLAQIEGVDKMKRIVKKQ